MEVSVTNNKNKLFYILLFFDFAAVVFFTMAQNVNVYRFAVVGAIYELAWLPMLSAIFLMPVIALFFWDKDKFSAKSKFLLLLLLSVMFLAAFYYFK